MTHYKLELFRGETLRQVTVEPYGKNPLEITRKKSGKLSDHLYA